MTEVCHGVTIEPHLQPLSGETLSHQSAITEDGACLDVAMYGFWGGRFEKAFVDVRVFNPSAQSNRHSPLSSVYRKHEQEKRRQYYQRIREVEKATFTPLVLSTTGRMGRAATTFYKRLASMVGEKRGVTYATTLNWIRCRLSFALLRLQSCPLEGQDHHNTTQVLNAQLNYSSLKATSTNLYENLHDRYIYYTILYFAYTTFVLFLLLLLLTLRGLMSHICDI